MLLGHPYRIEDTVEHHIKECENDHLGRAGAEGHLLSVGPHVVDRHGVQYNQKSHQRVWDPKLVIEKELAGILGVLLFEVLALLGHI